MAERLEDAASRYRFLSIEELLWALDVANGDVVADLGSGTGFYADDVAPHATRVYAIDLQEEMQDYYRRKGVPGNVELITSDIADLPLDDGAVDVAYATMTFHEFVSPGALREVHRIVRDGGRFVIVDWAASGTGDVGPPTDERFDADAAVDALREAGFAIEHRAVRPETFLLIASTVRRA